MNGQPADWRSAVELLALRQTHQYSDKLLQPEQEMDLRCNSK